MTPRDRRIRLDLAYDGTDFCGWQVQPNERTVQGVLQDALSRVAGDVSVGVRGAGRTDSGVHAHGQVADAMLPEELEDGAIEHALRRMLPPDVRPLRVFTVAPDFHPRYRAISKTYRYHLDRTPNGDPFRARFAAHRPGRLNLRAIEDALGRLRGRRDWTGFTAASCTIEDRVRHVHAATYEERGESEGVFTFSADGFLTHMVRNLVGTLLDIARGRFPPDRIDRVLETGDRHLAGPTAPAAGLALLKVRYDACYETRWSAVEADAAED